MFNFACSKITEGFEPTPEAFCLPSPHPPAVPLGLVDREGSTTPPQTTVTGL